ncbi:MAG: GNAT family N-acetyltransferase [Actinophytocola sp.]|uniref:GNAT family N-acetyltransferase n=1 Tax=Actinophytocola sp. TaxID=1872138 RepID=UPI00132AEB88|nr:GNAT family N-acetyltransferase [Actinophytocola sp.]MPZ83811.1 GNAT family N-acetyltransferase [Actinophytocola sp.]
MEIRPGDTRDVSVLLDFFDEAVEWMVSRGNTEQWGTEPWSAQPRRVERIGRMAADGELWIAEVDGEPAGALIVSDRKMDYAPPVDEPELYVVLLLVSRRHAGEKIGTTLLDHARDRAGSRGVGLMRVDCYAGGTGDLVRYYTRAGYTPTETFSVGDWPGQLFELRL